jgi:hypothetical protein
VVHPALFPGSENDGIRAESSTIDNCGLEIEYDRVRFAARII